MQHHVFATAFGFVGVAWRDDAITSLRLPSERAEDVERALRRHVRDSVAAAPPAVIATAIFSIQRYFAGEAADFAAVAVDLGTPTAFGGSVYAHIRQLGRGETTTYGAIARAFGAGPEAARAVGRAMATNPVPLIIPCHRVLAAGALGGFSAPGGTDTKARMLALEGATVSAQQAFAF